MLFNDEFITALHIKAGKLYVAACDCGSYKNFDKNDNVFLNYHNIKKGTLLMCTRLGSFYREFLTQDGDIVYINGNWPNIAEVKF